MKTKTTHPQIKLIFGAKYDGVVDAVHYARGGKIDWVRAYERRGPTWSDHVLLDRAALVARLKAGKRFYTGARQVFEASEFTLGKRLVLVGEAICTEGAAADKGDQLEGLPAL